MPDLTLSRLSYSTLAKHKACAKKLFLTKGTPYKGLPSWAGVGGRAFHALAERYDREGCPEWGADDWIGNAEEIFLEAINEEAEKTGIAPEDWRVSGRASKAWPDKETRAWWLYNLPSLGEAYAAWRAAHPELQIWVTPDGEEAIELELRVEIPGVRTPFLAYVDRVFENRALGGALAVVDLKSGSMPVEDLEQLVSYASLMEIRYTRRPEFGGIYGARKGALQPVFKDGLELMPLGHVSTETWLRGVRSQERIIATGEFPASPGRHCNWCDVAKACTWAKGSEAWKYDPDHPAFRGDLALAA